MSGDGDGLETDDGGESVTVAHGAGSGETRRFLEERVVPRFGANGDDDGEADAPAVGLGALDDGAVHEVGDRSLVVTTDSHVVSPLSFPGGDIGRLAVAGTVNDLAVMGATDPLALTCSLVVEEGTSVELLDSVLDSMQAACEEVGCRITAGDTKVMGSGEVDGVVVNTTGVGVVPQGGHVTDAGLSPGDKLVVSGPLGDHGITLLTAREGFDIVGDLESDVAPVGDLVAAALDAGEVTAMKDPTRGGFATAINEMVRKADVGATLDETAIPVREPVASAGELLGIDPLDVANEGKVVFGVAPDDAEAVVEALRATPSGQAAAIIGEVTDENRGRVVLDTGFGRRYLSEPEGRQLPRIC
ncbi:hydrogenase expression/formation protein HypE [Halorussus halobius]|uniref:hydrogenase expression/formation protein HypE n=1 Tax=Halorussus halobius TaxID=1710537 RepID=UPI001093264F|nr:hydrogenase expression/formation protein HypE [Halorussus halobius]